jgi:serine/threonine-protein kinase
VRLLAGAVTLITGVLAGAFLVTEWRESDAGLIATTLEFVTTLPNAALFWLVVGALVMRRILKQRRLTPAALTSADGLLLQMLFTPCLLLYATSHHFGFSGFPVVLPFLTLFILTRAILVPSSALRTALLSSTAPIGMLAIQLYYGNSFARPGDPYGQDHFVDMLVQNQVILIGAIGVACVASRVNLGLRRRSYEAGHLGQYEIHGKIGAGAMGEVYEATHSLLRRGTAIKLLRPEIAGESSLRRFEQEVKQTSRLTHPNAVSIYDYGHTADGVFYYAMELLEGANLREIVDGSGPMPPGRVIHVLSAACGALSEAHTKGMVHRDIKPGNIMLCELGGEHDVVKILDFGLVKDLSKQAPELDKVIMGTPETMAPEAVYPDLMGPRADLYSLAAVGYHLLTGTPVFTAADLREYLRLHQTKHPEAPQDRLPGVPDDLSNVILRGLSKDPGMRPKNAATMRAELLACKDTGTWHAVDAAEWWADFERPQPGKQRPASSGSESVIATALIGEETALLIDSSLFDPEGRAAQAAAAAKAKAEAEAEVDTEAEADRPAGPGDS